MKRLVAAALVCAVVGVVAATPAGAATYPRARTVLPTAGFALTGDGTEYRNFDLQNNYVTTKTAGLPFEVRTDWQSGRRLFLNITSNASNVNYPAISYTCVTGPEDPLRPTNKNSPALGSAFYLSTNRLVANIQCYNAAHDAGYFVSFINPQDCITVTQSPSTDPRFEGGDHYVIEGPNCTAHVSVRSGTKLTQIKSGSGKSAKPVVFNVPIYLEFDSEPAI
ncbi:MAG TPA: hypothetical protein VEV43_02525 [Actinomycetota bacterium]|nr:hypothetical protein [Actinomycetota bacterium]